MSYTPTSWTTGDTITASALNKIEQGIANAGGSAPVMVTMSGDEFHMTSDLTFNEVRTAFLSGAPVIVDFSNVTDWGDSQGLVCYVDMNNYKVCTLNHSGSFILMASSADGYLVWAD